jgi:hypothetical protein
MTGVFLPNCCSTAQPRSQLSRMPDRLGLESMSSDSLWQQLLAMSHTDVAAPKHLQGECVLVDREAALKSETKYFRQLPPSQTEQNEALFSTNDFNSYLPSRPQQQASSKLFWDPLCVSSDLQQHHAERSLAEKFHFDFSHSSLSSASSLFPSPWDSYDELWTAGNANPPVLPLHTPAQINPTGKENFFPAELFRPPQEEAQYLSVELGQPRRSLDTLNPPISPLLLDLSGIQRRHSYGAKGQASVAAGSSRRRFHENSGRISPSSTKSGRMRDVVRKCYNCGVEKTPLWRRVHSRLDACNACGLYIKAHGRNRPKSTPSSYF